MGEIVGRMGKGLLLFLFLNMINLVLGAIGWLAFDLRVGFNVFTMVGLIEGAMLMILAGFMDVMESAVIRRALYLVIKARDYDREIQREAQRKALVPLTAGIMLWIEGLLIAIILVFS